MGNEVISLLLCLSLPSSSFFLKVCVLAECCTDVLELELYLLTAAVHLQGEEASRINCKLKNFNFFSFCPLKGQFTMKVSVNFLWPCLQ